MRRLSKTARWILSIVASPALPLAMQGLVLCAFTLLLAGCSGGRADADPDPAVDQVAKHGLSPAPPVLIRDATVFDGRGGVIENGSVLLVDGRVAAVGSVADVPAGTRVIDGRGKWVTPGIIDVHSHLGTVSAEDGMSDINETSGPIQAGVRIEESVWPQDPGFSRALAGGVTAMQLMPGSANVIGGRTVVIKNIPALSVETMKFPGAPSGLKMACGQNPKSVYNMNHTGWGLGVAPTTRMGNFSMLRQAFGETRRWLDGKQDLASVDLKAVGGKLGLETLAGVLRGEITVHVHCHRADEMLLMVDLAQEFGFRIGAFHHAPEAYKIADVLARENVSAALWAEWWGYAVESLDGIPENLPMTHHAGANAMIHSDHAIGIQHLNQEVGKALANGRAMGLAISDAQAWTWLSLNPAKLLGIANRVGTLERGRMADVVLWDGNPFSIYTRADKVFIDGVLMYSRADPMRAPQSDFELGLSDRGDQ